MRANLTERKQAYSGRYCGARGCGRPVDGISAWCSRHRRRAGRYGHALAVPITVRELRPWRAEARAFLCRHGEHASAVRALAVWNGLLERWLRFRSPKLRCLFDRLIRHEVKPHEILETVTAVGLMYWGSPERRLRDEQV